MRTGLCLTSLLLLGACLGGCNSAAAPGAATGRALMPATVPPPAAQPSPSAGDAGLAVAIARETADRAVREQTLRIQKQLREHARQQQQAREAAQRNDDERCMAGQKMRRVANGWVQAGVC